MYHMNQGAHKTKREIVKEETEKFDIDINIGIEKFKMMLKLN
jgi:hypothetical protein